MQKDLSLLAMLAASTCIVAYAPVAMAQTRDYHIPAGDLSSAISTYVRQSGVQVVYRADQMQGVRTPGISGVMSAADALTTLLAGSGFQAKRDMSGAFAIIRAEDPAVTKAHPVSFSTSQERPSPAQDEVASHVSDPGDIIVTARKREESLISVPVAITAVTGQELARRGVNSLDGVARMTPALIIADGGTNTGGNIVLRGIGGGDNPFSDQAVSFNIDGVQVGRASVRRMAQMDIQQIEVLKGPQALFYGKNSPAGIISIRTGDPTRSFEGKMSAGYEFNAHEWRGEGYVAGPITDDLGFRVAAYGSKMRGWVRNTTPRNEIAAPEHRFAPRSEEFAVRGTLKYEPSDAFDARLKVTYGEVHNDGFTSNLQLVACPGGAPQTGAIDDCRADDQVSVGALRPNFALRYPAFAKNNGELRGVQSQVLIGLEMNFRPSDVLTITSLTGYYRSKEDGFANVTATYVPSRIFASNPRLKFNELSQELRLASSFDGPINFMMGAHLQHAIATAGSSAFYNGSDFTTVPPLVPLPVLNYDIKQDGKAYSGFLQMQWDITDKLHLSAGGRYSHEKKTLPKFESQTSVDPATGIVLPRVPITTPVTKAKWHDFSPEFTLSYSPDRNLNLYTSYKHGFISGGFNGGSANFSAALDYNQQTVKGFEAGAKASLLGGALRANLALYTYEVRGLQVTILTQGSVQELKNVGKVRTKGGEFDISYRTPLEGLTLNGAVAYNRARYVDYFASCYRGQSKARGCAFAPVPGQPGVGVPAAPGVNGSLQNLAGTEVVRAPEWTGNVGFDYTTPVSDNLKVGLSTNLSFSSSYFSDALSNPNGRVPRYSLLDASLRVAQAQDRWEIALIGRNLTENYYWVRASDSPFTGTAPGNETGPAIYGDQQSPVSRGREILLRLSAKF